MTTPSAPARSAPAVATTARAARVLVEDDQARLLVWVATDDLAWTVARPTRLLGRGAVGVWALPGAPLTISGDGARVAAQLVTDELTVDGTIARAALVHRFRPTAVAAGHDGSTRAFLRAPDGPPLVAFAGPVAVRIVADGPPGWVLVEHAGPTLRVVGWSRRADVGEEVWLGTFAGGGFGYGMSDTARVALDAGACLFDEHGEAIGVQLAPGERYANDLGGGRWSVYDGTPWRLLEAVAIDRDDGGSTPAWQRCP